MLKKFMYGDWSSDYYGNNHWISKKLMKTDFYKDNINYIKNKVITDNVGVIRSEPLFGWDWAWSISEKFDFWTSFWTISWTISAIKNKNWTITTNFNIKDSYIFYGNDRLWDPIDNPLNKMWKYYQDNWYWKPFNWELNISQNFSY